MSNNPLVKKMLHGQSARPVGRSAQPVNIPPPRATWPESRIPGNGNKFYRTHRRDELDKTLFVGETYENGEFRDTTAIMDDFLFTAEDLDNLLRPQRISDERIALVNRAQRSNPRWNTIRQMITNAAQDTVGMISGSYVYSGPPLTLNEGRSPIRNPDPDRQGQARYPNWSEFDNADGGFSVQSRVSRRTGNAAAFDEFGALGTGPFNAPVSGISELAPPHMWIKVGERLLTDNGLISNQPPDDFSSAINFMRSLYRLSQPEPRDIEEGRNLEADIRVAARTADAGGEEVFNWINGFRGDRTWAGTQATVSFEIAALDKLLRSYSSVIEFANTAFDEDGLLIGDPVDLISRLSGEQDDDDNVAIAFRGLFNSIPNALIGEIPHLQAYKIFSRPFHRFFKQYYDPANDNNPRGTQFTFYDTEIPGQDRDGRNLGTDPESINNAHRLYQNFADALEVLLNQIQMDADEELAEEEAQRSDLLLFIQNKIRQTGQPVRIIVSKSQQPLYPTAQREERSFLHTNFSLQAPVVEDDCQINDIMSNVETRSKTARAVGEYRYFVNENLKFDLLRAGGVEDYPDPRLRQEYVNTWKQILKYEEQTTNPNHPNFNSSTYYGDLRQITTPAFPRYGSLDVPTYDSGEFVDLLTRLGNFDNVRNSAGNLLEFIKEMVGRDRKGNITKIFYDWYRASGVEDNRGWKDGDLVTKISAMGANEIIAAIEGQIEDFEPPQGMPGQPGEENNNEDDDQCTDLGQRIRRFLATATSREILQRILDGIEANLERAEAHPATGLYLPMILGDTHYTEPLFYRISRKKLETEPDTVGHVIERPRPEGRWGGLALYGGQYTLKPNFANEEKFTFQDRWVDYKGTYQYNVDVYTLAMRQKYKVTTFTGYNKANHELIGENSRFNRAYWDKVDRLFDKPEGAPDIADELYDFTILSFSDSDFEILNVPYVHEIYRDNPTIQQLLESGGDKCTGVSFPPITIVDSPPIPPEVEIVPYRGVDNKMLFMFGLSTGRFIEQYRYMTSEERMNFDAIHRAQKSKNCELDVGKVEFQSEGDDVHRVQIFRTTEVPILTTERQISAFGPEPHAEVERDLGSSFVDTIEPNVAYYYIFRSVDLTGNVSNPTKIYRVQINSEDGLIFPVIDIYDPKAPKITTKYRNFAKHIEIRPSLLMTDPYSVPAKGGVLYRIGSRNTGPDSGGVFGKSYLIRLTSIDTGRKIDIKVAVSKDEVRFSDDEE